MCENIVKIGQKRGGLTNEFNETETPSFYLDQKANENRFQES